MVVNLLVDVEVFLLLVLEVLPLYVFQVLEVYLVACKNEYDVRKYPDTLKYKGLEAEVFSIEFCTWLYGEDCALRDDLIVGEILSLFSKDRDRICDRDRV